MSNREMPSLPKPSEAQVSEESAKVEQKEPVAPKAKSIEVVALRPGFFKQMRKSEGDKFVVEKFEQLGSWMKCLDPVMEKKHQEAMKQRKSALRARASGGYDNELSDDKKPAGR